MINVVHNEDCLPAMRKMKDNEFDLAIIDPPYFKEYEKEIYPGAEISTTGIKRHRFESKYWEVPEQKYFNELLRISKDQIIWGINHFNIRYLGHGRIIWDKINDYSSFSKCEIAYCSLHKRTQIFRYMWNGMLQGDMKNKEIRTHPTQKPVILYKWLLKNYAKEGNTILDTHVGSGSSRIACWEMGFDFTGYEIDLDYWEAQEKRFKIVKNQQKLF